MKTDDEAESVVLQKAGGRFGVSRRVDGDAVSEGEGLKTCHRVPGKERAAQDYSEVSLVVKIC